MEGEREPGDGRPESGRAAYRRFVRANHPDVGGDPELFVEGLRRFSRKPAEPRDDRFDRPIVFVRRPRGLRRLLGKLLRGHRRPPRVR